ncbi:hypothetical protein EV178_005786 [Coemansia sp. RSA 1646]|nr:hypothetical protein EV178_005786 [Coemansia sp. RSA 1646]KAJ1767979.1 hypothetical protein LPJ74_005069 [Coemansia sp. RSA 1843]KAJ2086415.1 hypothetical protein IW138_005699 [Coemansia sp. RSA 986]KAJ2211247.1 hypothetical protein EV179_005658 [Coemansia sp. RSA 487]
MTSIPLPLGCVTCYFVRHGERVDHIDADWTYTAPVPYDPPLTAEGSYQARRTGALIHSLEKQAQAEFPDQSAEYLIVTSPFLRCAQTSEGIYKGFEQAWTRDKDSSLADPASTWKIAVEPGLSEVMSENYFSQQVPNTIISWRKEELEASENTQRGAHYAKGYTPACERMPVYPENFQSMMARFVSTLDQVVTRQIDQASREALKETASSSLASKRKVVIFVTHGAGVGSFLWATTQQIGFNDIGYCCVTRAKVLGRKTSLPLPAFGTSRVPAYSWQVDYNAYLGHLARPSK